MKHRYFVTTYDPKREKFTPQKGVKTGPWSKWGLRKPLRQLRQLGYPADRDDPSVLVERDDGGLTPDDLAAMQAWEDQDD